MNIGTRVKLEPSFAKDSAQYASAFVPYLLQGATGLPEEHVMLQELQGRIVQITDHEYGVFVKWFATFEIITNHSADELVIEEGV